jgi:hypothetical protein
VRPPEVVTLPATKRSSVAVASTLKVTALLAVMLPSM